MTLLQHESDEAVMRVRSMLTEQDISLYAVAHYPHLSTQAVVSQQWDGTMMGQHVTPQPLPQVRQQTLPVYCLESGKTVQASM